MLFNCTIDRFANCMLKSKPMSTQTAGSAALVPLAPTCCAWDRLQGESISAFSLFSQYRLLPSGQRSFAKLASSLQLAAKYSRKFAWIARCAAWDEWLLTSMNDLALKGAIEARLRHNA